MALGDIAFQLWTRAEEGFVKQSLITWAVILLVVRADTDVSGENRGEREGEKRNKKAELAQMSCYLTVCVLGRGEAWEHDMNLP